MKYEHVFLDVKSGLRENGVPEIVDVAAIRTDRKGNVLCAHTQRVTPRAPVTGGGYEAGEWGDSNPAAIVFAQLESVIFSHTRESPCVVVAHHADAVREIVRECGGSDAMFVRSRDKTWICTAAMAWPLFYARMIADRKLMSLAAHYGVTTEKEGSSAGDSLTLKKVYWEMIRRYRTALKGEQTVDELGGETFRELRTLFGF